jgi:hypothetical protein
LVIKLKEIRTILKDKTAKIIPNAITIVTDNERYFFTSFAARDKTYTTLFRVWQIALADAVNIFYFFFITCLSYLNDFISSQ